MAALLATLPLPDAALDKISLTYIKTPLNFHSIVERKLGIFAKHFAKFNLPVEYSSLTNGPDQVHALAAGDIHFLNAVGSTSVFLSASNGADIKILSIFGRSSWWPPRIRRSTALQTCAAGPWAAPRERF